jgi:dienelactone hydrolase
MKRLFKKIAAWLKARAKSVKPGKNAVKGASMVLLCITAILFFVSSFITSYSIKDPWIFVFFIISGALIVLLTLLANWALKLLFKIPKFYRLLIIICFILLSTFTDDLLSITIILLSSIFGASIYALFKTKFKNLTLPKKIVSLLGFAIGISGITALIVFLSATGIDVDPLVNAAYTSDASITHIAKASPAEKGSYKVKSLNYGSGKDKHQKHFGADVDIKTDSVNGVAFLDNWEGISGWWRTKFWGFDSKALPLNAQVWYPEGDGPFPLVLVVHGNHSMQDFSDPGYAYLGELLASRGMIVASVDENFINSSWTDLFSDGLKKENDARGWLLLEHLKLWHNWNADSKSPFYNKIDTDKLSLIGHSRGGEAVAHAALLNTLPYYSDDASIKLDYNYNIKSIIAIAPVDGQYAPGNTRTKLKNINYFTIHGSQDGDVSSFAGSRQFDRITFTDSTYHFKTGLYVHGANHGQFNTSWGNNDVGTPFTKLLNLEQLLSAEDQQKIAQVYISAFLETTLKDNKSYLPLFTDTRAGKNWLPETIYLNQFQDSNTEFISTFDEDFDVTTTTVKDSSSITSTNLTVWKEKQIPLKRGSRINRALFAGWHYKKDDIKAWKALDSTVKTPVHDTLIASYSIKYPKGISNTDSTSVFVFSMAESKEGSNPKASGKWVNDNEEENDKKKNNNEKNEDANTEENITNEASNNSNEKEEDEDDDEKKDKKKKGKDPIDLSIILTDINGETVYFPLSQFSALQRRLAVKVWKKDFNDSAKSENVMQLFSFPIEDLLEINPNFNSRQITEIRFVFDRTDKGVVVIDNVGFMKRLNE